jgi:hypothetical protein
MGVEPRARAHLVVAHEPGIPSHIGDQDCGKPSLDAFFGHVMCLFAEQPTREIVWVADG